MGNEPAGERAGVSMKNRAATIALSRVPQIGEKSSDHNRISMPPDARPPALLLRSAREFAACRISEFG
jgi:hypothetical protein